MGRINLTLRKSKHFSKFESDEDTAVIRHYPDSGQDSSAFEHRKSQIIGSSHPDVVEYLPILQAVVPDIGIVIAA